MKTNNNTRKMVMTALFTALVCVATMVIRIPTPGTNGYIHPGDALVILSGVFLGPSCGFLAAGLGSGLADFLGGYLHYVPVTFLIKGLIACLSAGAFRFIAGAGDREAASKAVNAAKNTVGVAVGGVIDIAFVAGGYWIYESFLYGAAAALASVPSNVIQGVGGLVLAVILYPVLHTCYQGLEREEREKARTGEL